MWSCSALLLLEKLPKYPELQLSNRTGVVPQLRLTGRELVDERQGLRIGLRHVGGGEMIGGGIRGKKRESGWKCVNVWTSGEAWGTVSLVGWP
jgi:hypothetical protein